MNDEGEVTYDEGKVLYIPTLTMRTWGKFDAAVSLLPHVKIEPIDLRTVMETKSIGYIPVYEALEDLYAEHGVVPFHMVRITPAPEY
jgi:hypothetical protein